MTAPIEFANLSTLQMEALCSVAFGESGAGFSQSTLRSLVRRGLIEPKVIEQPTRFGKFTFTVYEMPLPVHIAFCAWCEEQPEVDP